MAGDLQRKQLKYERDRARTDVDPVQWDRLVRRFGYLLDHGVSLETLIAEHKADPVALRVLEEEAPVLARGSNPLDSKAGIGYEAVLEQAARGTYGDAYEAADDRLKAHERSTQFVENALNGAGRGIRGGEVFALLDHDGSVLDVA